MSQGFDPKRYDKALSGVIYDLQMMAVLEVMDKYRENKIVEMDGFRFEVHAIPSGNSVEIEVVSADFAFASGWYHVYMLPPPPNYP